MPIENVVTCVRRCRCNEQSKGRLSAALSCGCITGVINETFVCVNHHPLAVHHQSCNSQTGKPLQQAMPLQVAPPPPPPYRCIANGGSGSGSLHSSSNSLHQPVIRSNSMHQSSSNGCNAMLHVQIGNRVSMQSSSGQVSRQASASSLNSYNAYSQQNSHQSLNTQSTQCNNNPVDTSKICSRCVRCALPSRPALERSLQEAKARVAQLKQELECSRHSLQDHSLFCRTSDSRTSSVDCVHCSGDRIDAAPSANNGPVFSSAGSLNTACNQLNGSCCTVASTGSNGGDQHTRDLRIRMLNNYMQQATESIYGKQRQPTSVNGSNHSLATNSVCLPLTSSSSNSLTTSNLTTSASSSSVFRNGNGCLSAGNLVARSRNGSRNQLQDSCSSIVSDLEANHIRASNNSVNEHTNVHPTENIYSNQQMIRSASDCRFSNSQGNLSTSSSLNLNVPTPEQPKQSVTLSSMANPTTAVAYSQRVNTPANCQMASISTNVYPINYNGRSVPNSVHGSGNMLNSLSNNGSGSSCSSNQSSVTSGCSAASGGSANLDRHRLQQSLFEARERVAALKKDLEMATSAQVQQLHTRLQQQQQQLHQKQMLQQQHDQLHAQKQLQQQQNQQLELLLNRVSNNGSVSNAARLLQPPELNNDMSPGYGADEIDGSDSYPLYQNLSHLQLLSGQQKLSANSQAIYTNLSSILNAEHSPNSAINNSTSTSNRVMSSSERTMLELEANYDLLSLIDKYYRKNESSTAVEV